MKHFSSIVVIMNRKIVVAMTTTCSRYIWNHTITGWGEGTIRERSERCGTLRRNKMNCYFFTSRTRVSLREMAVSAVVLAACWRLNRKLGVHWILYRSIEMHWRWQVRSRMVVMQFRSLKTKMHNQQYFKGLIQVFLVALVLAVQWG